jgi:hypothetical protein
MLSAVLLPTRIPEPVMLGPAKPRRLDESIAVSLEDLVPADNFYRHLEATANSGGAPTRVSMFDGSRPEKRQPIPKRHT